MTPAEEAFEKETLEGFDEMVRDFTAQGHMAKSEARARFEKLMERAFLAGQMEERKRIVEALPKDASEYDFVDANGPIAWNACRAQVIRAITTRATDSSSTGV